eukprot:scaffold17242_cov126-Isochrysis_galbana.AAC.14
MQLRGACGAARRNRTLAHAAHTPLCRPQQTQQQTPSVHRLLCGPRRPRLRTCTHALALAAHSAPAHLHAPCCYAAAALLLLLLATRAVRALACCLLNKLQLVAVRKR